MKKTETYILENTVIRRLKVIWTKREQNQSCVEQRPKQNSKTLFFFFFFIHKWRKRFEQIMVRNLSLQREADAACTADGASTNRHSAGGLAHTQLSYCSGMEKVNSEDASKRAHTHLQTQRNIPPQTEKNKTMEPRWWCVWRSASCYGDHDRYPDPRSPSSCFLDHICSKEVVTGRLVWI